MSKNIINVGLISVMCTSLLYAMDLEYGLLLRQSSSDNTTYESITNNISFDIRKQQHTFDFGKRNYSMFLFSLEELNKKFFDLPNDRKHEICNDMSEELSFLLRVAICLPSDVIKRICELMMDGEVPSDLTQQGRDVLKEQTREAVDTLYKKMPVGYALDRYHDISLWLANKVGSNYPIGPVFTATQHDRDVLLGVQALWNSSVSLMSIEEKERVDKLGDLKNLYLKDKKIYAMPMDGFNRASDWYAGAALLLFGPCIFGSEMAGGAAVGACMGDPGCVCSTCFLTMSGGSGGFVTAIVCLAVCCTGLNNLTKLKQVTI